MKVPGDLINTDGGWKHSNAPFLLPSPCVYTRRHLFPAHLQETGLQESQSFKPLSWSSPSLQPPTIKSVRPRQSATQRASWNSKKKFPPQSHNRNSIGK